MHLPLRRWLAPAIAAIAVAGCGTASTSSSSPSSATLTIATEADSPMSPALAAPPLAVLPAYDPLIYHAATGGYEPDLATSWGFAGRGSQSFQLRIRTGAKFSDGTPLTATAVAASLNWFLKSGGHAVGNAGPVSAVTASGDTVQIHYSQPVPEAFAVFSLTQDQSFGLIVGPKGIANAKWLATHSDGVGPYVLSPAQSTAGVEYTFTPNRRYFSQAAVRYAKVVVKPIANASTRLNAVETGQVSYAFEMPDSAVQSAKAAGLNVVEGGGAVHQLLLEDRSSGPLRNPQVRQAIAYAINRTPIIRAVFSGIGRPISSLGLAGYAGYDAADPDPYPYNPAQARKLLAVAGYPHGFTINVLDAGALDPDGSFAEAVASQLQSVGIKLQLNVLNQPLPQFLNALFSKKYQAVVIPFSVSDIFTMYYSFLRPGGLGNAFKLNDPTVDDAAAAAASAAAGAQQTAGLQKMTADLNTAVWSAPVAVIPDITIVGGGIKNVASSYPAVVLDPFSPDASQAWHQ